MQREVRLEPKATVSAWSSSVYPATSPYPWLGTGSTTPHEAWGENKDVTPPDPEDGNGDKWVYCWPDQYGLEHLVEFEQGPTLSLFTKVTLRTRFDTFQTGPNNWYYPPDNAYGPGLKFTIRNRAKDGWIHAGGWSIGVDYSPAGPDLTDKDAFNSKLSEGNPWSLTPWLEYSWTSHPEGGPWELEDINNLAAGVTFLHSNGPSGKPYDFTQGSFFKIRVPNFLVILTVQDLGGYVRSTRHNGSANLRMHRKARNTITLKLPAHEATKEIGETVHLAHARGSDAEGQGWGVKALERRSGWITQRTYWPENIQVHDIAYDLKDFNCEAWAAFRIPIAWTPELSGMAYLDRGGEFTMSRAQDGWSLRPGDGCALRVLDDYLNLSEEGLAIHSGGDEEIALYNFDPDETGWTTTDVAGDLVFTSETESYMVEELGYQESVLFTFGGNPTMGGKKTTFDLTAGDTVSVRVRVRNISVDDPNTKFLQAVLLEPGGKYWDEANRTWSVAPAYSDIPSDEGYGEVILDQVPDDGTGTYTLKVGRFSSAINSCAFVCALVSVQKNAPGCGMPLVTLDAPITRVGDVFEMDNAGASTFWHLARGMAIFEFRPFWRAADLPGATEKVIAKAYHSASATDTVYFTADTTDQLVFDRFDGNVTTQTVAVDILDGNGAAIHVTRGHYLRVFVRWLDGDGWRDRPPYEAMIGYALYEEDGTFVSYGEATAVWSAPAAVTEDYFRFEGLDGWMRWFEVKRNPLTGSEAVWRR
jgi:hypothetical protein